MCLEFVESAKVVEIRTPVDLVVCSDSTTAVSWARKGDPHAGYKSVEMRAMVELANALSNEVELLRRLCTSFEMYHIPGLDISDTDRLSRLLYRPAQGGALGQLLCFTFALTRVNPPSSFLLSLFCVILFH